MKKLSTPNPGDVFVENTYSNGRLVDTVRLTFIKSCLNGDLFFDGDDDLPHYVSPACWVEEREWEVHPKVKLRKTVSHAISH